MAQKQRRRPNSKRRRRGRHPGLYKLLSAVLIAGAVVAACLIFFRVNRVEVLGNQRYATQEIIDIAGVREGNNLFTVRGGKVARQLQGRLPYIREVSVRRKLPNTLVIEITEGEALAAIAHGGQWWLLDEDGKILEQASAPGTYAQVTGVTPLAPTVGTYLAAGEEQKEKVAWLKELLAGLEAAGLAGRLGTIDLTEDYRVTFTLDGRFTVHISPAMERGMGFWLQQLGENLDHEQVAANQSYTVEIMNDKEIHFIPR